MEYTKGEWFASKHHGGTFVVKENRDGIRTTIATIEEAYPTGKGQDANAQLIASAPDLYEACKAVRNWYYQGGQGDYKFIGDCLKQALAKAEGVNK